MCPPLLNKHASTCISALHGSQESIHAHGLSAKKASTHLSSVPSPWRTSNHPCPWPVCMENQHAPIISLVSMAHKQPTMTMACLHRRPTPIYHQCCLHGSQASTHAHGLSAWKTNTHLTIINAVSFPYKQPSMTMACLQSRPAPTYHQRRFHGSQATIHDHGLSA